MTRNINLVNTEKIRRNLCTRLVMGLSKDLASYAVILSPF